MKFNKIPVKAIALSIVTIFISVVTFVFIQVAGKVEGSSTGPSPLAIITLVFGILLLTSLSTQKPLFTKIIQICCYAAIALSSFIVAIVCASDFQDYKVSWDTITFLVLGIICLISSVLFLVYYLIGRKPAIILIAKAANVTSLVLFAIFAVVTVLSGFFGVYKARPLYAIELGLLLGIICVLLGINLSLEKDLVREK